ncbi:hypothetical protein RRSWK_01945 [Rhodopirellula sp. SWK7]|nr:hypothetical protein RRSWK_01945 [Rhodopirellula sp. SWK7]
MAGISPYDLSKQTKRFAAHYFIDPIWFAQRRGNKSERSARLLQNSRIVRRNIKA